MGEMRMVSVRQMSATTSAGGQWWWWWWWWRRKGTYPSIKLKARLPADVRVDRKRLLDAAVRDRPGERVAVRDPGSSRVAGSAAEWSRV